MKRLALVLLAQITIYMPATPGSRIAQTACQTCVVATPTQLELSVDQAAWGLAYNNCIIAANSSVIACQTGANQQRSADLGNRSDAVIMALCMQLNAAVPGACDQVLTANNAWILKK